MSVTGSASSTNLNVLRGKIRSLAPYAIDPTLSVEGSAADAKAVGDELEKKIAYSDIVDDLTTSDSEKPLSAKQGAKVKQSVDDLRNEMNLEFTNIETDLERMRTSVTGAENSANAANEAAIEAKDTADGKLAPDGTVAMTADFNMGNNKIVNVYAPENPTDVANKEYVESYVDSKRFTASVTLNADSWATTSGDAPYFQNVSVAGVTEDGTLTDVLASPNPSEEMYSAYNECGIRLYAQHDNEVEFMCKSRPEIDIDVNLAVYVNSVASGSMLGLLNLTEGGDSPVTCSLDGEEYAVGNATLNGSATNGNYDFTVI